MKSSPSESLTQQEYFQNKAKYIQVSNKTNPRDALTLLQHDLTFDHALARSCHILTHEIGQSAYRKYNSFGEAIEYSNEVCNSGYLHGVIEAHFSSKEDVLETMTDLCEGYRPGSFVGWQCYHGIGHGLMYFTSNELNTSVEFCESFATDFARSNCINGVYMENFNTEQKLHPSSYLDADDPYSVCAQQKHANKYHCYYYAPTHYLSLHKNEYVRALRACQNVEEKYINNCISGVGGQMMKENINNLQFVENICLESAGLFGYSCLGGMIGIYINHYGSLEAGQKLCEELRPFVKDYCYEAVDSRREQFL